ncbi:MAG: Gx transporter family protein [Bacillota bacterium]
MNKVRRMVLLSLLVAMASAVHYIEGLVPVLISGLPGVKLGLANVFSLFALVSLGAGDAFIVVVLRCLLTSVVWGQAVSLAYSLAGGLLSTLVMWIFYRYLKERLSLYGISAAGAFFHNVGQLFVAALILQSGYVFGYLPVMTAVAVPTGLFVGMLTQMVKRAVDMTGILRETGNGGKNERKP